MTTELDQPKRQSLATVEVEGQRAIAEVQAAMVIARKFPRDTIAAVDRIKNACTRPALANQALYTYSRGGSDISGPSIRLAEAIAQNWGNLQFGIRELEQRDGESTVEAFAWDVETNVRQTKVFQVGHERHTRQGSKRLTDPRDIYELVANQGARRLRACILGVIPGDVIEDAVAQCEVTMKASADITPEGIKKLLEAFEKFGVTKAQIEKRIQRKLDAIQPAQVINLRKIHQSLRDGMSQPGEWFESEADGAALAESIGATPAKNAEKAKANPEMPLGDEKRLAFDVLKEKTAKEVDETVVLNFIKAECGAAFGSLDEIPEGERERIASYVLDNWRNLTA